MDKEWIVPLLLHQVRDVIFISLSVSMQLVIIKMDWSFFRLPIQCCSLHDHDVQSIQWKFDFLKLHPILLWIFYLSFLTSLLSYLLPSLLPSLLAFFILSFFPCFLHSSLPFLLPCLLPIRFPIDLPPFPTNSLLLPSFLFPPHVSHPGMQQQGQGQGYPDNMYSPPDNMFPPPSYPGLFLQPSFAVHIFNSFIPIIPHQRCISHSFCLVFVLFSSFHVTSSISTNSICCHHLCCHHYFSHHYYFHHYYCHHYL